MARLVISRPTSRIPAGVTCDAGRDFFSENELSGPGRTTDLRSGDNKNKTYIVQKSAGAYSPASVTDT